VRLCILYVLCAAYVEYYVDGCIVIIILAYLKIYGDLSTHKYLRANWLCSMNYWKDIIVNIIPIRLGNHVQTHVIDEGRCTEGELVDAREQKMV
jgi:hypothetical protein